MQLRTRSDPVSMPCTDFTKHKIYKILSQIPSFSGRFKGRIRIKRISGMTNHNYSILCGKNHYVLRLSGKGTTHLVDRKTEFHNAKIATEAGINAEILYFNEMDGSMLTQYISNANPLASDDFRNLTVLRHAIRILRRLHQSKKRFKGRFEIFEKLNAYRSLVHKAKAELPKDYRTTEGEIQRIHKVLKVRPKSFVPCHCDPVPENFIASGDNLFLIDWEYSGMGESLWDLSDLSAEASFNTTQDELLLNIYFDGHFKSALFSRMLIFKSLSHLLWSFWGLFQSANYNDNENLHAYALERYDRCKAILARSDFGKHLELARHCS